MPLRTPSSIPMGESTLEGRGVPQTPLNPSVLHPHKGEHCGGERGGESRGEQQGRKEKVTLDTVALWHTVGGLPCPDAPLRKKEDCWWEEDVLL